MLSQAEEKVWCYPLWKTSAIEGKGVQGQIDQQLVTLGNGKLHDGTAMDPELEKRMVDFARAGQNSDQFVCGWASGLA